MKLWITICFYFCLIMALLNCGAFIAIQAMGMPGASGCLWGALGGAVGAVFNYFALQDLE